MNTLPTQALDAVTESPMHALIRTVLQTLHLIPRSAPRAVAADDAAVDSPLYEQSFVTEREAREFAEGRVREGYRAQVQQDIYDYCWSVEVFEGNGQREQ